MLAIEKEMKNTVKYNYNCRSVSDNYQISESKHCLIFPETKGFEKNLKRRKT